MFLCGLKLHHEGLAGSKRVLAGESDDRLDVGVGLCGVWDMSSARKHKDLHTRKRLRELGDYRREGRRALVAEREEAGWENPLIRSRSKASCSGSLPSSRNVGAFSDERLTRIM